VNVKQVSTLIAMARAKVHTDRELAALVGVSPTVLAEWKSGVRPISPESVVSLCDVLQLTGEEAREWVALAIIENPKNASKSTMLRRALFACWALGVVAPMLTPKDAPAMTAEAGKLSIDRTERYVSVTHPLYIVAHLLRLLGALRSVVFRRGATIVGPWRSELAGTT
jgi:DNA-binding transcriptional regulator YdaS (Cro superfamily)